MASDAILRSYGDVSAKEDVVMDAIEILTAKETQIFNMLGKGEAVNTVHSYLTDTLRTAASKAVAEGGDYTLSANSTPSRLTNLVEIVAVPFAVTRTQQDISHYHGQNELERQTSKALMDWGNAAEFDLVRSTLTSGASGTAPKLSGIVEAISKSTNTTAHNSGTVWDATILDGLMKDNWDNSNGDVATDVFMGSFLRKATDGFTQKSNTVVNNPGGQTKIVRTVTTYETAFGTLSIHTHRYVQQSTDATGRILALRPEKLKVAFLKRPYIDTGLARSGDYDKRAIVGSGFANVKSLKFGGNLLRENTELNLWLRNVKIVAHNTKQATLKPSIVPRSVLGKFIQKQCRVVETPTIKEGGYAKCVTGTYIKEDSIVPRNAIKSPYQQMLLKNVCIAEQTTQ